MRFLRQLSIPNLGRLPQTQQERLTPVVLGLIRFFHLVSERLDPFESFVGPISSSFKLGNLSSGAGVRISSTFPRSLNNPSKLKRRLQLFVELLPRCCRVQSSSSSASIFSSHWYILSPRRKRRPWCLHVDVLHVRRSLHLGECTLFCPILLAPARIHRRLSLACPFFQFITRWYRCFLFHREGIPVQLLHRMLNAWDRIDFKRVSEIISLFVHLLVDHTWVKDCLSQFEVLRRLALVSHCAEEVDRLRRECINAHTVQVMFSMVLSSDHFAWVDLLMSNCLIHLLLFISSEVR